MNSFYRILEKKFEKFAEAALQLYGNSVTFIIAIVLVITFLASEKFYKQDFHDCIRDIIVCITFLSFFIIQKAFNKYSTVIHLKMNELVASHDNASNRMVNIEEKTELELQELARYYTDLAKMAKTSDNIQVSRSIENVLDDQHAAAKEKNPSSK
jgi:low affinity Fe/Cu permease